MNDLIIGAGLGAAVTLLLVVFLWPKKQPQTYQPSLDEAKKRLLGEAIFAADMLDFVEKEPDYPGKERAIARYGGRKEAFYSASEEIFGGEDPITKEIAEL